MSSQELKFFNEARDLRQVAKEFQEKLRKIKVFLTDVDGVLTDSKVYYLGEDLTHTRAFHVQDGYGLKILQRAGIQVGFISGGASRSVSRRAEILEVDFVYLGDENKCHAYLDIQKKTGVKDEEILYIGDEFFDMPLLRRAGFSVCPPHASYEIQDVVDYITVRHAGEGLVREVIDILRYAQDITPSIPDFES